MNMLARVESTNMSDERSSASRMAKNGPAKLDRLTYIDGARGYLLTMMYLAHSATTLKPLAIPFTSILRRLHHHRFLAVWDAEFFVPLSGFVCGLAYFSVFKRAGWAATWRAIFKRLRWVYIYQIVVAMIIVILAAAVLPLQLANYTGDPTASLPIQLLRTLTFVNQPMFLDILLLYIILMLGMPFGFALLVRGRNIVFGAILVGLWLISYYDIDKAVSDIVTRYVFDWQSYFRLSGAFNPFSWSVLFYAGLFLGYQYKSRGLDFKTSYLRPNRSLFFLAGAICGAMVVVRLSPIGYRLEPHRHNMSWQSFVIVAAVGYSFYYVLNCASIPTALAWLRVVISKFLSFPPLVLLGQNSLFVYSFHVIVIAAVGSIALHSSAGKSLAFVFALFLSGYPMILAATWLKRRYLPTLP